MALRLGSSFDGRSNELLVRSVVPALVGRLVPSRHRSQVGIGVPIGRRVLSMAAPQLNQRADLRQVGLQSAT